MLTQLSVAHHLKRRDALHAMHQDLDQFAVATRSFRPAAEIFVPGQLPEYLYILTAGWAFSARTLGDGRRQILDFHLPGDLMPPEILVANTVVPSYQAITPIETLAVPFKQLNQMLSENCTAARFALTACIGRLSMLSERLISIGRRSAYERLVHLLLELRLRLSRIGACNGDSFSAPLTQELIADALGLSVIHINRTIQRVRSERLFQIHAGAMMNVRVMDVASAMRVANFEPDYLAPPSTSP